MTTGASATVEARSGVEVEIVTIGTELLLGFTVDGNTAMMGQRLAAAGLRVTRRTSVPDIPEAIQAAVSEALDRVGVVICSGGLGPTRDDLTVASVAELLGLPLAFDEATWQQIEARFARFGRTPSPSNRVQAMVPAGATVLPNRWGSAPGLWIPTSRGAVVLLPGVPTECEHLLEAEVLPRLRGRGSLAPILTRTLRTSGVPESTLGELTGPLEASFAPITLAYLPQGTGVDLRLTAWSFEEAEAKARLDAAAAILHEAVGQWIYGEGADDLAAVLLRALRSRGLTLALAESCTGGMLGSRVTAIPGASDVFLGGIIAYANREKIALLGVESELLERHGAVSVEVAEAMARGAAQRLGADVAVALTGVAGPDGGSVEKPVGTVCFGFSIRGVVDSQVSRFSGERREVQERAAHAALLSLLRRLG